MKIETNIKIALVAGALLLLLGNAMIFVKNYKTDWRDYQKEYFAKVIEQTDDEQLKEIMASRKPRIEQLIVNEFGEDRVDRCLTCHLGIDDDRFATAEQPFKTHPSVPGKHDLRAMGCTICHEGNGRGLTTRDAHGHKDEYWMTPLLIGDYTESACAKCHPAPYLAETPHLKKGAELYKTKACYGCHKIEGISEGILGVELTHVGEKWKPDYLMESLVDPKANNLESLMPKMKLTEEEKKALLIYLESLTGEDLVDGPVLDLYAQKKWAEREEAVVEVSVKSGEKLFKSLACNACHSINEVGGNVGPELSVVGLQRTEEWIIQHFIDPRAMVAGSLMPDFDLSQTEMKAITSYLMSLKDKTIGD